MMNQIQGQGATASFGGAQYVEFAGISGDTKPTGNYMSGSIFLEVDTGKVFFYNGDTSAWVEQFSFQG